LLSVLEAQKLIPSDAEYNLTLLAADQAFNETAQYAVHVLETPGTGFANVTSFTVVQGTQLNATVAEIQVAAAGGCGVTNGSSSSSSSNNSSSSSSSNNSSSSSSSSTPGNYSAGVGNSRSFSNSNSGGSSLNSTGGGGSILNSTGGGGSSGSNSTSGGGSTLNSTGGGGSSGSNSTSGGGSTRNSTGGGGSTLNSTGGGGSTLNSTGGGGSTLNSTTRSNATGGWDIEYISPRALAGVCVDEGWVLVPAAANDSSIHSVALFALQQVNAQKSFSMFVTLVDVIAARANVVDGAGISYSLTVTAGVIRPFQAFKVPVTGAVEEPATGGKAAVEEPIAGSKVAVRAATAAAEVATLKAVVWQPVPFTAYQLTDLFVMDGGAGGGQWSGKGENRLFIDCVTPRPGYMMTPNCTEVPRSGPPSGCAPPRPGYIMTGNCTEVPKSGHSAAVTFSTLLLVPICLALVLVLT
ncbi:hypothetical protein CLOP_g710, partial [Closterium sp. NIES-67]